MKDIMFFISNNLFLCTAWGAVLALLIAVEIRERLFGPKCLSTTEITQLINNDGAVLLDLRIDGDYSKGHICQAENFNLSSVNDTTVLFNKLEGDKDRSVVLVCKDGLQSKQQAFKLQSKGLANMGYLQGGMTTWQSEGLPTVSK